jgi:hypothetical protein
MTTNEAELAGSPLSSASWQDARGRLQIDGALDLGRFSESFAAALGDMGQAGGAGRAKLVLSRANDDDLSAETPRKAAAPDVDLLVWTDGLRVGKKAGATIPASGAASGFSSDGVDVQVSVHVDGNEPKGELKARLVDTEGIFAGLAWRTFGAIPPTCSTVSCRCR